MRACEGCRRRKIKCDAATTNTWPCSACIRLKLSCVPPTVNYDRDVSSDSPVFQQAREEYENGGSGGDDYHQQMSIHQQLAGPQKNMPPLFTQQVPYSEAVGVYQPVSYGEPPSGHTQQNIHYNNLQTSVGVIDQHQNYPSQPVFSTPPLQHSSQQGSPEAYEQDQYGQRDLANLLGELRMNEAGTGTTLTTASSCGVDQVLAPYLNNKLKTKTLVEEPAFEEVDEYKDVLPPSLSGPDLKVRIPPELMPDEETVLHYFDMYFSNVHPYVPVLNKTLFYQQWHTNREAISPLILEAIFAIAGRLADEPAQGQQWLALASSKFFNMW